MPEVLSTLVQFMSEYQQQLIVFLVFASLYFFYRYYFKGITFKCEGNYDLKGKNIGKPLPAYPNGWYVAIRSERLEKGKSEAIDVAGENIVVFRSSSGTPYALEAYCKHLGANLGIGGKVVNEKCIQCPFHGWLYDGQTGICVDHDGKPAQITTVQYDEEFCQTGKKLNWKKTSQKTTQLRKYPVCQLNNYIYVWIHAMQQYRLKPFYPILDLSGFTKGFEYRATAIHDVKCHIQDLPENGADALHFKFVHAQIIENNELIKFQWKPRWMRGDNPDLKSMFEHREKYISQYKQRIYKELVENYPRKQFLSVGYIDNYMKLPILGYTFFVNITIIQVGSGTVFIFLKGPFFTTILFHYLIPKERYRQVVYHDGYSPKWLPLWMSALVLKTDAVQVSSDMKMWDTKKFVRNIYYKKGQEADNYLKNWRQWFSQYYQGCSEKQKNRTDW